MKCRYCWRINYDLQNIFSEHYDPPPPEIDGGPALDPDILEGMVEDATPEQVKMFWKKLSEFLVVPDEDLHQICVGAGHNHLCKCGEACNICLCTVTGDIYWRCRDEGCNYLEMCQDRNKLTGMDVGQILRFGESSIDRYTNLRYIMRSFGKSFGIPFWSMLSKRPQDADFVQGSYQMPYNGEYDCFISYRGASGRFPLQLTLCGYYNMLPALCIVIVFCPICVALMNLISNPCEWPESSYDALKWLTYGGNTCKLGIWKKTRTWFIFRAYIAPLIILTVLFWNPWFSRFSKKKYFLDKYC